MEHMTRTVLDYHEVSKHRLERYARGPGYLDWATQPDPFRTYAGCERVELPLVADGLAARFNDLRVGRLPPAAPLDGDAIAALLELSLGLSAWKSHRGASWALRCNPSSGNLHPTEGYVVCDAMPGLDAGVHHYVSRDHALERRARLAVAPHFAAGVVVGLSSIYWREAWKYGARAFRYCAHDCGHAIAAVAYAAAALGWRTRCLAEPGDADVARLLGLDRDADFAGAEREAPDCLLWVGTGGPPTADALVGAVDGARWSGAANALSPAHVEWREIDRVDAATLRPRTPLAPRFAPRGAPLPRTPALDLTAATITRQRRSAVDFDGVTAIDAEAFYAMLDPLVPRAGVPPWEAWPHAPRVHLALFVHRVTGLAPGLYVFVRAPEAAERLRRATRSDWLWRKCGPNALDLFLLIEHDLRDAARTVSCHQDIAADACFALGMLADFAPLEREPWRYRELYWECGMVGQVLYLEAEAAGIRATGIGCFFDDPMHRLLGLPVGGGSPPPWQSLYHFTAGGAVDDARLGTLPPYSFGARSRATPASR
jgi:SagB-type dehydrogenase family enzyme